MPPKEYQEPFYKDQNNREKLKPHLVHALANAELYGMTLTHLYKDVSFRNLNNWGIIQALARKGVNVNQPKDCSLTETVLIQTGPLKMSAHMEVINALMSLFIKEIVTKDCFQQKLLKFSKNEERFDENHEESFPLLFWINQSCEALRIKVEDQKSDDKIELPKFEKMKDILELSDGVNLLAVCALYYPGLISWTDICFQVEDPKNKYNNITKLKSFLCTKFPCRIFHFSVEDLVSMHSSMKLNVECMISDLYLLIETELDEKLMSYGTNNETEEKTTLQRNESFDVQKSKTIPLLSNRNNFFQKREILKKELLNHDTKSEESGESESPQNNLQPAGRPSERIDVKLSSLKTGRRTRRNSTDDTYSQISLENIGGSIENIDVLGRNPDKEMKVHCGKKSENVHEITKVANANSQTFDVRKTNCNNGVTDNKLLEDIERLSSSEDNTLKQKVSFADLSRKPERQSQLGTKGINITYKENSNKPTMKQTNLSLFNEQDSSGNLNDQLNTVRIKLEERRKKIEEEKNKLDTGLARQLNNKEARVDVSKGIELKLTNTDHQNSSKQNFSKSLLHLNDHINVLNTNIKQLAIQQDQIQKIMQKSASVSYLRSHDNKEYVTSPELIQLSTRKTWDQPKQINFDQTFPNNSDWIYSNGPQTNYISQPSCLHENRYQPNRLDKFSEENSQSVFIQNKDVKNSSIEMDFNLQHHRAKYRDAMSYDNVLKSDAKEPFRLHNYYDNSDNPNSYLRKVHVPVPAPTVDDMAPQNISFIESSTETKDSSLPSSTTDEKGFISSKIPFEKRSGLTLTDCQEKNLNGPEKFIKNNRNTISSSFKENRKSSNEIHSSSNNQNLLHQTKLTDEEVEILNNMKTEVLKDTGDPSKGFLISFDDETVIKPKPLLKGRKNSAKNKNQCYTSDPVLIMLDMNEECENDKKEKEIDTFHKKENDLDNSYQWDSLKKHIIDDLPKNELSQNQNLIVEDNEYEECNVFSPDNAQEMAKKKEKIIMQSLRRKQIAEENKRKREEESRSKKEETLWKLEELQKKKEEEAKRREAILETYRMKKEREKAEEEGKYFPNPVQAKPIPKIRNNSSSQKKTKSFQEKPKRLESSEQINNSDFQFYASSPQNASKPYSDIDQSNFTRTTKSNRHKRSFSQPRKQESSLSSICIEKEARSDGYRGSRESLLSRRTFTRRGSVSSLFDDDDELFYIGSLKDLAHVGHKGRKKSSSISYLGPNRSSNKGRKFSDFDDGLSDVSSTSGWSAYGYRSGSRNNVYREPSSKSNRPIIMNAIEHVVFPGVVNKETRLRVLEEIDACDCPHFLILFRDTKYQFRGLYAYYPDTEEVFKIYGTGPKQVTEDMFEKFFKYNSGGKKFTQIHTKSLTVTIDAFTIFNSLWLGKKTKLPNKRAMPLVV